MKDKTYLAPRCEELALPGRPSLLPSGSLPTVENINILASTSVKQRLSERPSYDHGEEPVGGRDVYFFAGRELRARRFGILRIHVHTGVHTYKEEIFILSS